MKYVWGVVAAILGAIAVATVRPDLVPVVSTMVLDTPLAQIISLRAWLAIGFVLAAIFLFVFSLIRRRLVDSGRIAGTLGAVLLLVGLLHGGTVFSRGISNPSNLGPDRGVTSVSEGNGSITVMTYNLLGGQTSNQDVAELVTSNGVDVVALPETSTARGAEIALLLSEEGLSFQQFDTGTDGDRAEFESTVLLVSSALGEYRPIDLAPTSPLTVSVAPANGVGPQLIAGHPRAPLPERIDRWREDITEFYALCDTEGSFILAGDFNSTADHQLAVGASCADAAAEAGAGGMGTWPSDVPAILASPIDRVLHDGDTYVGSDAMLVESGGSDHRGLIVRLSPKS